ncbi:MAG: hypothetical protein PHH98_02750 [Candidatus Gracilibacteria bacterium]|nr:hypothetical protein [Candidatus Gracilibacteria bacterium]
MKKFGIISSIIIVVVVFLYAMTILSNSNTCSGVRVFDCQKSENVKVVTGDKNSELRKIGDLFLKYCVPEIKEEENDYLLDYSSCKLNVKISKDATWVNSVSIDGLDLSRDNIDVNFTR